MDLNKQILQQEKYIYISFKYSMIYKRRKFKKEQNVKVKSILRAAFAAARSSSWSSSDCTEK